MLRHPQDTSTVHGGPRTSDLRLRGGDVTTSADVTTSKVEDAAVQHNQYQTWRAVYI